MAVGGRPPLVPFWLFAHGTAIAHGADRATAARERPERHLSGSWSSRCPTGAPIGWQKCLQQAVAAIPARRLGKPGLEIRAHRETQMLASPLRSTDPGAGGRLA